MYVCIVTCRAVRVRRITGSSSDDWIYWHFGYNLSLSHLNTVLLLICTHWPSPGNTIKTKELALQITEIKPSNRTFRSCLLPRTQNSLFYDELGTQNSGLCHSLLVPIRSELTAHRKQKTQFYCCIRKTTEKT
jgi:hypothetical protein